MTTELEAAAAELAAKELATADAVFTPGNGPQGVGPDAAGISNTAGASAVAPMSDVEMIRDAKEIASYAGALSPRELLLRIIRLNKRYKGE